MTELIEQIKQWGIEREIDKLDPILQTTKTLEACAKLQQAIIRYEDMKESVRIGWTATQGLEELPPYLDEIKDAIGDIFITLVMLELQKGLKLDLNKKPYMYDTTLSNTNTFRLTLYLLEDIIRIQSNIDEESTICFRSHHIWISLDEICKRYNLVLEECIEYSYNEIGGLGEKDYD